MLTQVCFNTQELGWNRAVSPRDPGEGSRGFLFYQRIRKGLRIMIKVDLKGSEKEFESGVSVAEVAKSIGMGLYMSAC